MDKTAIKKYAVWARKELISRVAQKAQQYGITETEMVDASADSVNGRVLTAQEMQQRRALIELRADALTAKAVGLRLRKDLHSGNIALGVKGHGSLHIALEALLRALHTIAAVVELVHCADAVGGCIRLRHRQQGACNRGARVLHCDKTYRHCDCRSAHGCVARQPLAPQRNGRKRVGCLLHVITCLFFSARVSPDNS